MTYADTYSLRTYSTVKMANVASAVDGLLVNVQESLSVAAINTTGTTPQNTDVSIVVTCVSGQVVVVEGWLCLSNSATNNILASTSQNGTGNTAQPAAYESVGSTNGFTRQLSVRDKYTPSVGSNTYRLTYWSSAGTTYSYTRKIVVYVFQVS